MVAGKTIDRQFTCRRRYFVLNMKTQADYYLHPGNLFASKTPQLVATVLGSCVAVCLFDPVTRYGGINHFMLPLWNGKELPSPKYGNIAMEKLLEKMLGLGCKRANITAKIFGGGQQFKADNESLQVGKRNIQLAHQILDEQKIPILKTSTGGSRGRKLYFYTDSGAVMMKYIG